MTSISAGEYTVIGAAIAYVGVVSGQWLSNRSSSRRAAEDRQAAADHARAARAAVLADRRTDLELVALADVRATLDEMAQTLSAYQAGIIDETRDRAEKLECMAKLQTLGERLKIRAVGIRSDAIFQALDHHASQTMTIAGAENFDGALAANAGLARSVDALAHLLADRKDELLRDDSEP